MMLYLFDNQEQLIRIVRGRAIRSMIQTQTLTSDRYISDKLEVEIKAPSVELEHAIEYMAIPHTTDKYKYHLFFVVNVQTDGNITTLTGVQSGIEDLRKYPVYDIRPQNRDVRYIAEQILEGSQWTVGYAPTDIRLAHTNYYYISAFEALKKMCASMNVEMQFFVEINGNKVGNRYIEFKKRIGKNSGRRVVYGHNALKIVNEIDKTELYTALVGRGKGVAATDEETGEETGGYTRKITFEDLEWSKANGDPLDKPKGQRYLEDVDATLTYGVKTPSGNRPKVGFVEFDSEDPEDVLKRTYEALMTINRPQLELETTSVYIKDAEIGDVIRVIRHDRGLEYETRIFELTINRLSGQSEIKLGDPISQSGQRRQQAIINAQIGQAEDALYDAMNRLADNLPSADGFNTNWYTDYEPENPRVGDLWFRPDPEHEGYYILYVWNGEIWEELVRSYDSDAAIRAKIEELEAETQAMIEEMQRIDARNAEELAEFQEKLDNFDIGDIDFTEINNTFNEIKAEIEAVRETSNINAEMIGNDGITRYNKNILIGEFDRKILLEDEYIELHANDGGFKAGETYTISFEALCELLTQGTVTITDATLGDVTIHYYSRHPKLPDSKNSGRETLLYPDTYDWEFTGDWYKVSVGQVTVEGDTELIVGAKYKNHIDSNMEDKYLIEWTEEAEYIIDGSVI